MASEQLKKVFLSASIPLPGRNAKYFNTVDITAVRDAIIALTTVVLPKHVLVWGGHPSITPLIYYVMERLGLNIQEHVKLYQSLWFEGSFPDDNNKFENVIFTPKGKDILASIGLMREQMLSENQFSAAVFIGGMDGIEDEYKMFVEMHPSALILPIASTGAATKVVYDNKLPVKFKNPRLLKDYGYMSLFQNLLLEQI
ncbi:hypothetical protein GCM10028824_42740 [Hymenobacter segetis]|uniref:Uncharacterized protein n=1 Tax=Hymenobacter segetis TaxID=2025509 RepID=A0ABU9M0P8_9BACT